MFIHPSCHPHHQHKLSLSLKRKTFIEVGNQTDKRFSHRLCLSFPWHSSWRHQEKRICNLFGTEIHQRPTIIHWYFANLSFYKRSCRWTRPGCFCAKDCLDSVEMYTWWYTFTCTAQCAFCQVRWPCGQKLKSKNTLSDGKKIFLRLFFLCCFRKKTLKLVSLFIFRH